MKDANFPKDDQGRVYHLGIGPGMVANRIIFVGDTHRAKLLADTIDGFETISDFTPPRQFRIITGNYKGVKISIVGTLMGYPNTDFCVREIRAVTEGPLAIIRMGTCGTPHDLVETGDVVVGRETVGIVRNPDYFRMTDKEREEAAARPYTITRSLKASPEILELLEGKTAAIMKGYKGSTLHFGVNASADSFYSAQGRLDSAFDDKNEVIIDELMERYPETKALEMESFTLFDLADVCKKSKIYVGCLAIVLAQRKRGGFLPHARKVQMVQKIGRAVAETLVELKME
eukprot:gnl/Carplike_NY0171/3718_a5021_423.p1 GENE.gnl/Carplike_NY0171/3718_a5021_423~~gnl/Carplike_NY0171/3718_a5021_423.p1  ORF type:complete len:304 (+),score=82.50 gnl/Carplike_NY0171/3718_a5021_423:51-914(+)